MKIQGVVLAAGYGTRMKFIGDCKKNLFAPGKSALPTGRRSLVRQHLYMLQLMGISTATVMVKYKAESVIKAIGDQSKYRVNVDMFDMNEHQVEDWGAAWTVKRWLDTLAEKPDAVVVLNGDILWDKQIAQSFAASFIDSNALAQIAAAKTPLDNIFNRFGLIQTLASTDSNIQQVVNFIEKPTEAEYHSSMGELANVGIFGIMVRVFDHFQDQLGQGYADFAANLFQKGMLSNQMQLNAFCLGDDFYWRDIGKPEDLLGANMDVIDKKIDAGSQGDQIRPGVFIGKDCEIADSALAKLENVIIGDRVYIGAGATIKHSVIGPGWQIMPFTRIANSLLLPGFYVNDNQRVVSSHTQLDHVIACGGLVSGHSIDPLRNRIITVHPDNYMAQYQYDFGDVI